MQASHLLSLTEPLPMSPGVAIWLGTFIAAGSNILVSAFADGRTNNDEKKRKRLIESGMYVGALGPLAGLVIWKLFSLTLREKPGYLVPKRQSLASIVLASVVGVSLLHSDTELEAVNLVIWLRVAGGVWSLAGRYGADVISALAVSGTFHGVLFNPQQAPRALVKMTRQFLSPEVFDSLPLQGDGEDTFTPSTAFEIFARTFRRLFAYNYFLHLAAATVSFLVRQSGRKLVMGVKSTTVQDYAVVLSRAMQEATALNFAVSLSCTSLYTGCCLGGWKLGVMLTSFPLVLCGPRVRDTVYFLFVPWFAKYLFSLMQIHGSGVPNARSRIVMGVFLLEKPLKFYLENNEGYSWMVSVAFGIAQRIAGAKLAKW